jgi:Xaa-Pro aminopeptidase
MRRAAYRAILIVFIVLQAIVCAAGDNSYFAARREDLLKRVKGSIAVLQGAPDNRAYTRFRQDNNFYYLTGVETPNALLMLDGSQHRSILFLPPQDKKAEKWGGPQLFPGSEARRETGIDEVLELSRFQDELEKRKGTFEFLYTPSSPYETADTSRDMALLHDYNRLNDSWDGRISREAAFENNLKAKLEQSATIKDLSPLLDNMRRVKDSQEIDRLRESARIGALGLKEAMRSAIPGMYEYQIAAMAEFVFLWSGASGSAFYPIVGSGPNSCVIHYSRNNRKTAAGDIVMLDFGPDYLYYESDITRTFPISGKFSEEQAKVYQVVLDAQKAALDRVRPGATFDMLGAAVNEVLRRFGYANYLEHRVSHYVGMSTHDVGESAPFEAGVVIAVEPGVYMPDINLGIRIEDTVLVTKDGCEILSRGAPKEIAEIEKLMAERASSDFFRKFDRNSIR